MVPLCFIEVSCVVVALALDSPYALLDCCSWLRQASSTLFLRWPLPRRASYTAKCFNRAFFSPSPLCLAKETYRQESHPTNAWKSPRLFVHRSLACQQTNVICQPIEVNGLTVFTNVDGRLPLHREGGCSSLLETDLWLSATFDMIAPNASKPASFVPGPRVSPFKPCTRLLCNRAPTIKHVCFPKWHLHAEHEARYFSPSSIRNLLVVGQETWKREISSSHTESGGSVFPPRR